MVKQNTPGLGIEYEILVPAHFALVLNSHDDVEGFSIRSNVQRDFGNLDDVVIEVEMGGGQQHRFAFQLKHKESDRKSLVAGNFEGGGNFSLEKYCNAFKNMRDEHKKYLFILYTNANFDGERRGEVSNFDMVRCDFCLGSGFFNTSVSGGDVYRFEVNQNTQDGRSVTKEDYSQFFPRFFLYTCQKNFKKLKEDIVKILGFEEVFLKYVELFRKWHQGEFTNKTIDKKTLNMHLIDFYSSSSLVSGHHLSNDQNKHLRLFESAVRHFDVTVIDDAAEAFKEELIDCEISAFLDNFPPSLIEKQLEEHTKGCKMDFVQEFDDNPKETMEKCLLRLAKEHKFVERCAITLDANTKLKMLHYLFEKPLIFDFNETSKSQIYKMMELHHQSAGSKIKFVLLGHGVDVKKFSHLRVFENLNDLASVNDGLYRTITKTSSLSLQGRKTIYLKELIDYYEEISELTTAKELFLILKGNCLTSKERETLPPHYVPRSISVTLLDLETVLDHCVAAKDVTIINFNGACDPYENVLERKLLNVKEIQNCLQETQLSKNVGVISTNCECSRGQFEEIRRKIGNRNLHYFKHESEDRLMLVMSSQNSFNSKNSKLASIHLGEAQIHTKCDVPVTILCDRPGMGKSTLLKFLKNECEPDWWPLRVDLKAHNSFLKEKRDSEAVLTHFMELHQNQDPFLRKLKTLFLQKKKVIILLDGLDEIENVCVENILECTEQWSSVGYRVWLSSRQNLQQKLEDFFNIFVTQIDELSEEQQKFYVQNRLRQQYEEEEIEAIVAKIFDSIANNRHVLGVPLQLHIITQIFLDDRSYFRNVSVNWFVLTKMYKIFFEGRYKYSVEKKQPKNPFLSVGALEDQLEKYEIAALQSLFDDDVFASLNLDVRGNRRFLGQIRRQKDPLGIIVNINGENKAVFEHFTFGEYFAAVFLIHNFDKARLLKRHIFSERYQNLLLIFNLMLAEEDATQLAVVFKDSNRIRKCTHDEASRLSKGGRNLLQLAASCSTRYPLIRHDGEAISQKEIKGFKGETATMRKIVGFLSSSKIDPLAKDEVFEWDSFDYALASGSLYTIEAILENHERGGFHETLQKHYDDLSLAYYSLRFGYPNILSAIIARTGFALPKICCHSFLESTPILSLGVMSECARKIEILTVLLGSEKPTWWKKWTKKSPKRLKINTATRYGFTLLHFASAEGDAIVVDFLLKRGADVNVRNDFGHSPLHLAVKNANFDVATLLVDSGADIDARDGDSETPLHYAARSGHVDIIDLLVSEGAKIGDVLPCAVGGGHFDAVDLLVKKGANLSQVLLHEAASEGEVRIVELLLRQGLSVDARNLKGETALHRAVVGGRVEALRFLIQRGSDVGAVANNGDTLLHYAVRYWNHDRSLVDLLLSQPQTVGLLRVANEEGATPLHLAVYEGKVEVVGLILEKTTPDVDVDHEHYPLNFATKNGRLRKEALLEMARVIKKIKRTDSNMSKTNLICCLKNYFVCD